MSRSALWRQQVNVAERHRIATETFQEALEEGRTRSQKGLVKVVNDVHFNINPMLLQNISQSPYFIKCCNNLKDWNTLVDEIYYEVKSLEPWSNEGTKTPSTAFCLLLRLLTMRCTTKQMEQMLNHVDSPYIRCIGFLYIRYACDPKEIWEWFMPYLYDTEEMMVSERKTRYTNRQSNASTNTVGDFVRELLNGLDFYGTRLPRLPQGIERDIKVKLLQEEKIEERATGHENDKKRMEYFQKLGNKVRAMYGDEENAVTWYDAVVDRVVWKDDETGAQYTRPKFIVTFPEYGNTECVSLGEMDSPGSADGKQNQGRGYNDRQNHSYSQRHGEIYERGGGRWDHRDNSYHQNSRDDSSYHNYRNHNNWDRGGYKDGRDTRNRNNSRRDRSRSRDRFENDNALLEEVKRREREKVFAKGRDYGSRPVSFKQSLTDDHHSHVNGKDYLDDTKQRFRGSEKKEKPSSKSSTENQSSPPKKQVKKSAAELAAIAEKKRKLMAKYG